MVKIDTLKASRNSLAAHILENVKIKNGSDTKQFSFFSESLMKN